MATTREPLFPAGVVSSQRGCDCAATERNSNAAYFFDSGCERILYRDVQQELKRRESRLKYAELTSPSFRSAGRPNEHSIEFAVASAYHLPIPDKSVDFLLNCFSPLALSEFQRVIKPGGYFFICGSCAKHLWELKQVAYDTPYENKEQAIQYDGFEYIRIQRVERRIKLPDAQTIQDLFGMTPYLWKTPKEGIARLNSLTALEVQTSFDLHLFRRI